VLSCKYSPSPIARLAGFDTFNAVTLISKAPNILLVLALPALLLAGCGGSVSTSTTSTAPTANAGGPYTGAAGTPVTFNGSGSSDAYSPIASYAWSFGDGGSGTGVTPTHTYANPGTYTVSLTVTSANNLTSQPATTTAAISVAMGTYSGAAFGGTVLAGTTPLIGASVQLWAAGTSGNGSAPIELLQNALTTDSNGAFSVSTGYSCPIATSILFLVASGGHLNGGAANADTVLMTVQGPCNSIASGASFTVDEVTTVASVYAMAQFLKPGAQLGASSTNSSGITLAAATVANLVNLTTGVAPGAGFPATGTAPTAKINALANAVHACIISSAANSACTQLLGDVVSSGAAPTNTLDAMLSLAKNAATSVVPIYNLSTASSAFTPALTAAPADWVLYVTYGGGGLNAPSALALDSQGRVWVANYFSSVSLFTNTGKPVFAGGLTGNYLYESYGGAVDVNDNFWVVDQETPGSLNSGYGAVTEFNSQGTNVTGSPYIAGGIYYPYAAAVDSANVTWVVDYGDSHLTLLSSSGTSMSGSSGFDGLNNGTSTMFFPVAIAVDSNRNGWVANFAGNSVTKISSSGTNSTAYACCDAPDGLAIDGSGNVWVANYYGDSVSLLSASGALLSGGFKGGGIVHPQGIAIDGVGNVWVANYRGLSISELAGVSSSSAAGTALSPSAGWAPDANVLEAYALAIDAGGDVWVTSFGSSQLTEYIGVAAPVKTPLLGPVRVP